MLNEVVAKLSWYSGAVVLVFSFAYGAAQVLCAFVLASGVLNGKKTLGETK